MLQAVLESLNNWFVAKKQYGNFTIEGGSLSADFLLDGQYFRIVGSVFNDGLHKYPALDLTDETFVGEVWCLAIPQAVLDLATEIDEFQKKNEPSAFDSESFGGYSYHRATNGHGESVSWQDVFRKRLNRWRKIC